MKIYVENKNWADKGDVFIFSIITDEKLKKIREFLENCEKLGVVGPGEVMEVSWGSNEWFDLTPEDFHVFLDDAVDIPDEDVRVLEKWGIAGFDIYEGIISALIFAVRKWSGNKWEFPVNPKLIKPWIVELQGEEMWDYIWSQYEIANNRS